MQATSNRIADRIVVLREIIAAGGKDGSLNTPEKLKAFEDANAITWEEHFAYQNAQSRAFAMGRLTLEEAQICYNALGEVGSEKNGGWAAGTDLATKVAVTMVMASIL